MRVPEGNPFGYSHMAQSDSKAIKAIKARQRAEEQYFAPLLEKYK